MILKKNIFVLLLGFSLNSHSQTAGNGVTDINGNAYNSVIIGTQEWQKENLDVSKYTDGTAIPQVNDPTEWGNLTTGAWCYYNNDFANGQTYGKLYNWYAVAGIWNNASKTYANQRKKLAPTGYHVPSDEEWSTLTTYLGGENIAGGKMKETGTANWISPNLNATNSSDFTALPGGYRYTSLGIFFAIGKNCEFWSSSENSYADAPYRSLNNGGGYVRKALNFKREGFSVRCLRDSSLSNATFDTIGFKLYPNPALNLLNLSFNNAFCLDKITIVDVTGKVVLEQTENLSSINVEQLAKGVYIVTANDGEKKYQEKFIKE